MSPDSHSEGSASNPRKRSRAIAVLSQEQVQHKRDVDRRNQQAFRQRAKESMRTLEVQYAELQERCKGLESELAAARKANDALASCIRSMQDLTSTALGQVAHDTAVEGESRPVQASSRESDQHDHSVVQDRPDATGVSSILTPDDNGVDPSSRVSPSEGLNTVGVPQDDRSTIVCHDAASVMSGRHDFQTSPSDEILDTTRGSQPPLHIGPRPSFPSPSSIVTTGQATAATPWLQVAGTGAAHLTVPSYLDATCPLDQILLDFLQTRRQMILQGMPTEAVSGTDTMSVKALMHPDQVESAHPIGAIMSRVLITFAHVDMVEKLAFFYLMSRTMRWMINPTKQTYAAMPAWLRPTVTQITTPHAAWIDNIPWPGVRDVLIEQADEYPFDVFSDYYSQSVTVNWKFEATDAVSDQAGDTVIHSIFEKHICNLANWTVTKEFLARFPSMTAAVSPGP